MNTFSTGLKTLLAIAAAGIALSAVPATASAAPRHHAVGHHHAKHHRAHHRHHGRHHVAPHRVALRTR